MKLLPSLLPSSTEANPSPSHLDITRCCLTLGYYSNHKCTVIYFQSLFNAQGEVLRPLAGVNIFMQAIICLKTFASSRAAFTASFPCGWSTAALGRGPRGSVPGPEDAQWQRDAGLVPPGGPGKVRGCDWTLIPPRSPLSLVVV